MHAVGAIQVRLIVRAAAVDAIQVKARRPVVDQSVGIVLALEAAGGVEGEIVVDELAEVGIPSADAGVFFVIGLVLGSGDIGGGSHGLAELQQDLFVEFGGGQGTEHAPESAFEKR